ncbi:uncharacterized protein LOC34623983 [Cyclospora cayetanensis]|uniref:Uncharacterized protein LOC34623983 n=1 Tax=Cyclospora cayetanensis TaxID=88456 RepID=A0A6P6RYA1_9EIME|nr:uncharacterized protein LOC34623983 [Cyclospora cayetanensis]
MRIKTAKCQSFEIIWGIQLERHAKVAPPRCPRYCYPLAVCVSTLQGPFGSEGVNSSVNLFCDNAKILKLHPLMTWAINDQNWHAHSLPQGNTTRLMRPVFVHDVIAPDWTSPLHDSVGVRREHACAFTALLRVLMESQSECAMVTDASPTEAPLKAGRLASSTQQNQPQQQHPIPPSEKKEYPQLDEEAVTPDGLMARKGYTPQSSRQLVASPVSRSDADTLRSEDSRPCEPQQNAATTVPCVRVPAPGGGGSLVVDVAVVGSSLSSTLVCAALSCRGFRCLLCEPSVSYGGPHRNMRLAELLQWLDGWRGPRGPHEAPCDADDEELQQTRKKGLDACPCSCHMPEADRSARTARSPHEGAPGEKGHPPEGAPCPSEEARGTCGHPIPSVSSASEEPLGLLRLLHLSGSSTRRQCLLEDTPNGGPHGPLGPDDTLLKASSSSPFGGKWYSFGPFLQPAEAPGAAALEAGDRDTGGETETDASSTDSASTDATAETTYTATTSSTTDTAQTYRSSRNGARPPPLLQPRAAAPAAAQPAPAAAPVVAVAPPSNASAPAATGQRGAGPLSSPAPSLQMPHGDSPAAETPHQLIQQQLSDQQQQMLQQASSSYRDPLSAVLHPRRLGEAGVSEPVGDGSNSPQPSPAPSVYAASEQSLVPLSAVSGAPTDVGVAEAVEVAAAEAATAAAQAATAAADAAAADAAAAAGEPPGSVEAQRLQMRHELMAEGPRFLIDLMPKCIYTSSDIVNVLLESGAAKYLEFKTCDAAILTAELSQQQQDEEFQQENANTTDAVVAGLNSYIAAESAGGSVGPEGAPAVGPRRPRRLSGGVGVGEAHHGDHHAGERIAMETTPMSKGQIFQSQHLSLAEKRALMRFVAAAGAPPPSTVSAPFSSAAQWTPQAPPQSTAAQEGPSSQGALSSCAQTAPSPCTPLVGGAEENDCWDCFLERQGLNAHLRRLLTYGVCLCDLPLLPTAAAAAAAGTAEGEICSTAGHARRWRVREGLTRLQLFVTGCGNYGCKWAPLLYPLYGSGDLPQAFTRAAALSGALCMLGAPIERLQFVAPPCCQQQQQPQAQPQQQPQQQQQQQQQQHQQQQQQQQQQQAVEEEGMEAPLLQLAAQLQQRSSCMVLHCSNGERVAAKLLLYESGALPAPDVEPLILRGQAQAFYSCVSRKRQPKEDPSLGADGKDGRSAAPVENVFTATASAATFPEGQEEPVLSERALELPSVPSSEDKVSSCCRLIAICTEPVLGGSGFRMGVIAVRAAVGNRASPVGAAGEGGSSCGGTGEVEVPVHVLQTDAASAVAPKGYFLVHLSHARSAAIPCSRDLLLAQKQQQQQQQQREASSGSAVSSTPAACGCCSSGVSRWRCAGAGGQDPTAVRSSVSTASCCCGADVHCCAVLLRVLRGLLRSLGGLRSCYFLCSFNYNRQVTALAAATAAAAAAVPLPASVAQPKQVGASALEAQQAETFAVPAEAEASPGGRSPASESAAALAVSAAPPTSEAAALVGEPIQTDDPEVLVLSSVNNDGPASLLPMEAAPCAVLSLPNVCVSPCFPLLHDCEAARLMVEGLLRQPLEPQQLVVKGPTQAQEEARDAERHLAQTLDELTDLIESSEAAMPTPL